MTWPAGWTAITNGAGASGTAVRSEVRYRIATGSEGASITLTGASEAWVSRVWRITGHNGAAPACAVATGTSADAHPPYLGDQAYARDTLYLIHLAWDNRPAFTFWPTAFGSSRLAAHVSDSGGGSGWVQQASAATPGTCGISPGPVTSASAAWRALTIAVQPLVSKDAEEAAAKIAQRGRVRGLAMGRPPTACTCGEQVRITIGDGQAVTIACSRGEGHPHNHQGKVSWPPRLVAPPPGRKL